MLSPVLRCKLSFYNAAAAPETPTLSLHDALPIYVDGSAPHKIAKSEGGRTYVGVEYKNGVWVMLTGHEAEASASASSASA